MSASQDPGLTQSVPEVKFPNRAKRIWWFSAEIDERNQLEKDGSQSHNVRRIAAYGGILFAGLLYSAGLGAIAFFLGLIPGYCRVPAEMWHIVVAVLVALFSVPTVLVIAILKVTSPNSSADVPASVHEALGQMLSKIVDKIAG